MNKFGSKIRDTFSKISNNGLEEGFNENEKEKTIAFNWQVVICFFVSIQFIILGLFLKIYDLSLYSLSYGLLFGLAFILLKAKKTIAARYVYLFVTNFSVFTISYLIDYNAGFYLYFFTTPLTVYATFVNSKPIPLYIALSSYLINAFVMNFLFHQGFYTNVHAFNKETIDLFFNLNFILAFFMTFMFIGQFVKINNIKTKELENLLHKQQQLEQDIYAKEAKETKAKFQYSKLESEYKQMDMFNQIISHNLRGPISRVSGLLELLKKYSPKSTDELKLIEHMNTSVLAMDEIIKDLNFILVQKKLGHEKTNFISMHEVLQEVKMLLSNEIQFSAAEIHDHLFIEKVHHIKSIMVSIFYNLISNSIKYAMPNQNPIIKIIAEVIDENLIITFKDNGIGFDTEKHGHKIFQLYSRFHDHIEGKGMGLFLVKSHVEMMEGKIELESSPWKGATFRIILPLKQSNAI